MRREASFYFCVKSWSIARMRTYLLCSLPPFPLFYLCFSPSWAAHVSLLTAFSMHGVTLAYPLQLHSSDGRDWMTEILGLGVTGCNRGLWQGFGAF
jgi:hypothetical protein